ncbi:MAG TPA: hypothetical protein VFK89_00085 [Actinomycetota bacterium]|nr:hypothetical protein [Actinomycetota bacterium]
MSLTAVPNVSIFTEPDVDELRAAVTATRAQLLDVHADADHARAVLTLAGEPADLLDAVAGIVRATATWDLSRHRGVHPRLGIVDVIPFVALDATPNTAVAAARAAADLVGATGLPVYLYGAAAAREETRTLPQLRKGGLDGLMERASRGLLPDAGPSTIDTHRGVVCVGARGPLIAFNVWTDAPIEVARTVAAALRSPDEVRALAFSLEDRGRRQVSMNLVAPERVGIDEAFERARRELRNHGHDVVATEIVGLVAERFLPNPDAEAARFLIEPGRSIESLLRD